MPKIGLQLAGHQTRTPNIGQGEIIKDFEHAKVGCVYSIGAVALRIDDPSSVKQSAAGPNLHTEVRAVQTIKVGEVYDTAEYIKNFVPDPAISGPATITNIAEQIDRLTNTSDKEMPGYTLWFNGSAEEVLHAITFYLHDKSNHNTDPRRLEALLAGWYALNDLVMIEHSQTDQAPEIPSISDAVVIDFAKEVARRARRVATAQRDTGILKDENEVVA